VAQRAQTAIYAALFGVVVGSAALFFSHYATDAHFWQRFTFCYLLLGVAYTWYLFALLFINDLKPRRYQAYFREKIAVVIPCYDQDPQVVEQTIRTVLRARGLKQVIVIDDGSTNGVQERLRELVATLPITLHEFEEHAGKREVLRFATTRLLDEDVQFVVTVDSNTILDDDALVRVAEPLFDPEIGASTGSVLLRNERQNLLTRMIGTYTWINLNIQKQAQSVISNVVCCNGCLAAYRADLLREIVDDFANQQFLGERCTHSDDRHLTNLVLKRGYGVVYVAEATSWTEAPATARGFLRQQRRVKRGYIRESIYTLTYAWRVNPLLFAQTLCWDLIAPFLSFGLRIGLIVTAISNPRLIVTTIVPSWIVLTLVRNIFVPLRAGRKLPGLLLYIFYSELCLYWLNLWALFTVKNQSSVTRASTAQA
jgi:hyaluronan synthase